MFHLARMLPNFLARLLLVFSAGALAASLHAQQSSHGNDAQTLFTLANKMNGLYADDVKPWHLKITYKLHGASGKQREGTIEELWAGPHEAKLTIRDDVSSLTEITRDNRFYRDGDLDQDLSYLRLLGKSFVQPMLSFGPGKHLPFTLQTRQVGTTQLRCFTSQPETLPPNSINDPAYCLALDEPILRICSFLGDSHQFTRNHIRKFQERYMPMEIIGGNGEHPDVTAHVEMLETMPQVDRSVFMPGPNARLLKSAINMIFVPEWQFDSARPNRLRPVDRPKPEYPAIAQAAHVHGTVEMRVLIGTDGRVAALRVVKGPEMLRQAAQDAVWRWRFEDPYGNEGPAQALATISVRF